jgi:hypothetical protein
MILISNTTSPTPRKPPPAELERPDLMLRSDLLTGKKQINIKENKKKYFSLRPTAISVLKTKILSID